MGCIIYLGGCTLDDPAPEPNAPALTLKYHQNLSLTDLSWSAVKVTGFKEYVILQSPEPIPDNPTPVVDQNVSVLVRIKDADVTTFAASPSLISSQVCYKLYCSVDDRFLYSSSVCVDPETLLFAGFYDRACHENGMTEMALFDRNVRNLSVFDYHTGDLSLNQSASEISFPSMELKTWINTTKLFVTEQSPGVMRAYAFPSLTPLTSRTFLQFLWCTRAEGPFVFATTDESVRNFHVMNRNTLNDMDTEDGIFGNQYIAVFPGDTMTVLTLGQSLSKKYLVDGTGHIVSSELLQVLVSINDLQSTCAQGHQLFIGGRQGTVIDRNGDVLGVLTSLNNAVVQISRLTEDESHVVYLINRNGQIFLEIADLGQLPQITVTQSYQMPQLTYSDIILDGPVIYVMGTQFLSFPGESFVLKYPL